MTKIALITDTHFGVKQDNQFVHDYFSRFFKEVFFPELEKRQITTVFHLGDLVDRRKYINYHTLSRMREDFLDPLAAHYDVHILAGNHDTYYRDRNDLSALGQLLGEYAHGHVSNHDFEVYTEPEEITCDGTPVLLLPWICDGNREFSLFFTNNTRAPLCFTHVSVTGFEQDKGNLCTDGFEPKLFAQFEQVYIGHFHHKSTKGNITYLGAPYEMSWADYGDPKGFHILDIKTRELEFIPNPLRLFKKADYEDVHWDAHTLQQMNYEMYRGCYVKVMVRSKTNPNLFDMFIANMEKAEPAELRVVESSLDPNVEVDEQELGDVTDTLGVLRSYCAQLGLDEEKKNKLGELLRSLYNAASEMEV